MRATRCLVMHGRRILLKDDREIILRSPQGKEVGAATREGPAWVLRAREAREGLWWRGRRAETAPIGADGAVLLGRDPVLFAEACGEGGIRWHDIVAADARSLVALERLVIGAAARAPVWISGESGTGKEAAARAVHAESARAEGPYVALNCAAVPESLAEAELFGTARGAFTGAVVRRGAFVRADGGTLLLDEIGELPLAIQAKLLRVIESGEVMPIGAEKPVRVDVRVIASSWRDLEREVAAGRFRHDLLHRLWVLRVELLPLRDRLGDLAPLLVHMLEAGGAPELMPGAATIAAMKRYAWPGNVRELRNCVERAVAFRDPLLMLPRDGPSVLPRRSKVATMPHRGLERTITRALQDVGNHRGRAAAALGVSRSTLYRWLGTMGVGVGEAKVLRADEGACAGMVRGRVDTLIAPTMMAQDLTRQT